MLGAVADHPLQTPRGMAWCAAGPSCSAAAVTVGRAVFLPRPTGLGSAMWDVPSHGHISAVRAQCDRLPGVHIADAESAGV